jgi:thiol:disulfide interchange protein
MAGAVGAALLLSPPAAVIVFAGLGLGLALPFLLIGFVPPLRRLLPKPGRWMQRLRRLLALPMLATALALAWLLGQEAGAGGLIAGLAAASLLAAALWRVGVRQERGRRFSWAPVLPVAAAAIGLLALAPAGGSKPPATASLPSGTEPFDQARLSAALAEKRPVFLYFTADWCLTCKVNEKSAIERDAVRAAFANAGITVMVGDWTNGDPAIGRFLEAKGRSGVPLYLFYHRDGRVETLPQILTPGLLTALASS